MAKISLYLRSEGRQLHLYIEFLRNMCHKGVLLHFKQCIKLWISILNRNKSTFAS